MSTVENTLTPPKPSSELSDSHMPEWTTNTSDEIDPQWIRSHLPKEFSDCTKCLAVDVSNAGRIGDRVQNGATLRLSLSFQNSKQEVSLILKQAASEASLQLSKQLGLAREALFFSRLAPLVEENSDGDGNDDGGVTIPKVHYSWGNMETGQKVVIMEDLSSNFVDSGILFGNGNPNNWKRDLPSMIAEHWNPPQSAPSSRQVASATFLAIARVHSRFWKSEALLSEDYAWLRGQEWVRGEAKDKWEASQNLVIHFWKSYEARESEEAKNQNMTKTCINWDPVVREAVVAAVDGISWDAQLTRLNKNKHFTLVHGDFWPGNIMLSSATKNEPDSHTVLRLLDWEMVGLGSGPQDLGQYILSNMDPATRRECEQDLVKEYHDELIRLGVNDLSWEECWSEYKVGGVERWIWFLVYFCGQSNSNLRGWAQFFHDQIFEFMNDHNMTAASVTQPRP